MDPGYEVRSAPIDRSSRRGNAVVSVVVLALLGLLIAKPWATTPSASQSLLAPVESPAVSPTLAAAPVDAILDGTMTWLAATSGPPMPGSSLALETEVRALATHSGTWGIGDGGSGPRLIRDEVWVDWATVRPHPSTGDPDAIVIWPGTGVCTGLPILNDRPSIIAVTAPADLPTRWRLGGWWSDGTRVVSLAGSVRQTSLSSIRGVGYLQRLDQAPWPMGRYEFHVAAGSHTFSLTVCLQPSR